MISDKTQIPIPGTVRAILPDAQVLGPLSLDYILHITILLRSGITRCSIHAQTTSNDIQIPLSREEFAEQFSAVDTDITTIEHFTKQYSITVTKFNKAHRTVMLTGTADNFNHAFGIILNYHTSNRSTYYSYVGELSAPAEVVPIIEGVFGLDNRPRCRTKYHTQTPASTSNAFTPPELAKIYNFPSTADGSGQCIGIIELGGGSSTPDLTTYFTGLGISQPKVVIVSVDKGSDQPATDLDANGEVMLDIELCGAIAPAAVIAVYFAPNTDKGFIDAVTAAIHDSKNKPSVLSISWGESESTWTQQSMTALDSVFADAAVMGITICVAAGDNGSSDGQGYGVTSVDFPASSPHALSVGGTTLRVSNTKKETETVWNNVESGASGGGYSNFFSIPEYQTSLNFIQTGRGVPDVAANADPDTGYIVRVNGQNTIIGGTSAAAPMWAGLMALLNQELGHPVGFLNTALYATLHTKDVTNDIIIGNNGAYYAKLGWDPCTGWGSPNGQNLLNSLIK